ncbi:carbohydrate ABC transporter permease [Clavibacter michiganensis]|uniref:carbohydrate ABC transporter permease n=1 Tax=Clavibacter michiganensis TaxID=28447 RepID=UPI0009A80DA8|nr:sugar ABC transporter permease [Clavibacter michiganensis]MBE3077407.1 sugar ABC transporter permease [Clavibacter michiganensis subsp. michiganensis]MBF4638553.1 sugar ABC transporter permease [Clavibacter michiganensis subsp. michiganensis]MBW8027921.1 sugar ABC transporter permease [Clavibacter michiganensis subsp. michiganensis]MDO4019946.1 sugar ABC transporter permease [Clavibacter michiganensis]MDO4029878.1 sugar ABC transporter permease [Clavibacter michiganensis]
MSDPVANAAHRARSAPPPISPWKERLGRWDYKASPYAYIAPFFIVFAIVGLFPLLYTAYVSLHDWDLISGQGDFVGLGNFTFVLSRPVFWVSLGNTLSIFVLSTVPQIAIALVLASVLNANIRAKTFWRMGVLLPYVVAPVAVTLIFSRLFADQSGLVNAVLELVGADAIGWHRDSLPAHVAIATMVNFRWTGFNTLVLLAAMQAIPRELYEAAIIDGAGRFRQFVSITVPSVRPTIIFVTITSTIGGLQIFDEPRLYDAQGLGGNSGQWKTITLYLYELGWNQQRLGRAAAVAWLLFLLIVIFALVSNWLSRRIASGDATPVSRKTRRKSRVDQVPASSTPIVNTSLNVSADEVLERTP